MLPATDWPKSELWSSCYCFKEGKCQSWSLEREGLWWAEGLQAEGCSYSFTSCTALSEKLFRFLICIPATNEKKNEQKKVLSTRLKQPENVFNLCFFILLPPSPFLPTETENKPAVPIMTHVHDMDSSSPCPGQNPWARLGYTMNNCHIALCLLLKRESCRVT